MKEIPKVNLGNEPKIEISKENIKLSKNKIFHLNSPTNVQIEVTENCNHSCFYCYNHWREDDYKGNKMSSESANNLMDIILKDVKPFEFVITGGEPLQNMPATLQIAKRLRGRSYSLNTNLTLMNDKKFNQLLEANSRFGVLTSLPHYKQEQFQQFTKNKKMNNFYTGLERVMKKGVPTTVNMVVHKYNKDDVKDEAKFLFENYGVTNFAATPVLKPSFRDSNYHLNQTETNQVLKDLLEVKEKYNLKIGVLEVLLPCSIPDELKEIDDFKRGCTAGRTALQIAYNGDVRACGHSPYSNGNMFEDSFRKIWDSFAPYRENQMIPDECNECLEVYNCGGGCRFEGLEKGESHIKRRDSRMTSKILGKRDFPKLPEIDNGKVYEFDNFLYRKEKEGTYNFYNGKILLVNEEMKNLIVGLSEEGKFRVNDFPNKYQERISHIGKKLLAGGFLK